VATSPAHSSFFWSVVSALGEDNTEGYRSSSFTAKTRIHDFAKLVR
jgi:hypothetical protein